MDPMEALDTGEAEGSEGGAGAVDPMEQLDSQVEDTDAQGAMPVRADEFEQEAERVVEGAKGLDGGAAEEGQVKLVHQVRHQVGRQLSICALVKPDAVSSGRCPPRLSLCSHLTT